MLLKVALFLLTLTMAILKRSRIVQNLNEEYHNLFASYPDLYCLVPSPIMVYPKRVWERKMYRARAICRGMRLCDETGQRSDLHNFILKEYEEILDKCTVFRGCLPDPAEDITDTWMKETLLVLCSILEAS